MPFSWALNVLLASPPLFLGMLLLTLRSLICHHGNPGWPGAAGWYPRPQATSAWEEPGRRSEAQGLAPEWVSLSLEATCSRCCQGGARGSTPPYGPSSSTGHGPPQPRLEDEIDFLAQELAGQEAGRWGLTALPQPEAPHRLLEPGETQPCLTCLPTSLTPAWSCSCNLPSFCSSHPGALRARPGPGPGLPLHSGSPCAHTPHHLGLPGVVWARAHVPPEGPGRAW